TVSDVITGGTEGAVQQGPVRARVLNDLSAEEKERYKADIRAKLAKLESHHQVLQRGKEVLSKRKDVTFVVVQKALFKEVKEMEEIFDQMNNEVDKNTVDKECAEIEKKNLLIENENLIVNCLSTQLLYDVQKSRCLDLEANMSKVSTSSREF
ncbi:hypothetical protein Tco_0186858, partial [Tanacetum coccineum]